MEVSTEGADPAMRAHSPSSSELRPIAHAEKVSLSALSTPPAAAAPEKTRIIKDIAVK